MLERLFKSSKKKTGNIQTLTEAARPGDGVGYPVDYTGERLVFNHELLKRCKSLAAYSGAYRLNATTVVKTGEAVRMSEVASMKMVAERTSIPIPRVLDAYVQSDGRGVIIMEYMEGLRLNEAWPMASSLQQSQIIDQLRGYVDELSRVTGTEICTIDGLPCNDPFFPGDASSHGVFANTKDFHKAIGSAIRERNDNSWTQMIARFVESLDESTIKFCHNDLDSRNILVRDGKVVAILDWELSGYFPSYWEYIKAYLWADWNSTWITQNIPDRIMQPRIHELACLIHARDAL